MTSDGGGRTCYKIDRSKFTLQHADPDLFHRSQWDTPGQPSGWYCVYRSALAGVMLVGVAAHAASTKDTLGWKWFIYMTNQGILLLTINYLVYAGIVLGRRYANYPVAPGSLPLIYSLSWGLQTTFFTVALWISIIYWAVLHKYVVEYHLMKTPWMMFLNVFLHAGNTLSCLIDIFITARPFRVTHFYLPILFGVWYSLFSVIYWAAGGLGICRCEEDPAPANCTLHCDKYIYPILDWQDHPGNAVAIVLGGMVCMPLLQAFWWGLSKLRLYIFNRSAGRIAYYA